MRLISAAVGTLVWITWCAAAGQPGVGITPGAAYEFEAAGDISGDAIWLNIGLDGFEFYSFTGPTSAVTVNDARYPGLQRAYRQPAAGVSNAYESRDGTNYSQGDAAFELMFAPDHFIGQQILLEVGGSARGVLLALDGDELVFWVDGNATAEISVTLPSAGQFYHVVGTIDLANNETALYLDGNLVVSESADGAITDWAGGNPVGLGEIASSYPAGGTVNAAGPFSGQIGVMRFYPFVLTEAEICNNQVAYTTSIDPPPPSGRPNVVILMSDDAGFADWGFQGSSVIPTPHIDQLAASGVLCTNAYTGSVCSPSRAMFATGMYGARFGYELNITGDSSVIGSGLIRGLPPELPTIFDRMKTLGYTTGVVGKWHIGKHQDRIVRNRLVQAGNRPQRQGVDEFWGLLDGSRQYWAGNQSGDGRLRVTTVSESGQVVDDIVESDYAGQYVTDVFGDWSADFIRRHHAASEPFFLFASFTAPHTPLQATAADLASIDAMGNGLSGNRRTYAAMQLSFDRNVGKIMEALADPNADGDPNASILDNTLVILLNDNGGDCCDSTPNASRNTPLRSGKGSQWEGGLRIPMIFAGAGLDPNVIGTLYHAPVHSIDVLPTVVALGGGDPPVDQPIDGVNLLPFLNGDRLDEPHPSLFLRRFAGEQTAVRQGDWKLVCRPSTGCQLFNLQSDMGESNDRANEFPEVVQELLNLLTFYDVQMDKPRHDNISNSTNQFDDFQFRSDVFSQANWGDGDVWTRTSGSGMYTVTYRDAYANTELTFTAGNTSYTATNNLRRVGIQPFLMNRFRFISGSTTPARRNEALLDGLPVLLANSLSGAPPELSLEADAPTPGSFAFRLALDIAIHDDLRITGDGNQRFVLEGALSEARPGRGVIKEGASELVLNTANQIAGEFAINGGSVVANAVGSLGLGSARIGAGGTLQVSDAIGTQTQLVIEPAGTLAMELTSDTIFGQLDVAGDIALSGNLLVLGSDLSFLQQGDRLPIITFSGQRAGAFANVALPAGCVGNGLTLEVVYEAQAVYLEAVPVDGDLDGNAARDMVDVAQLQRCVSNTNACLDCCCLADLNGDGASTGADWPLFELLMTGPPASEAANIVLIISDDAGWADFGFMGSTEIPTPHLDQLAANGVVFTQAYTGHVCSPSRAQFLTGLYPSRFGYYTNIGNWFDRYPDGLRYEQTTLFERLQSAGYTTGVFGKWHVGAVPDDVAPNGLGNRPPRQGVDQFVGLLSGSRRYFLGEEPGGWVVPGTEPETNVIRRMSLDPNQEIIDQWIELADSSINPLEDPSLNGIYLTDFLADEAGDFIAQQSQQPFFIYLSFTAPHAPLQATTSDLNDPRIAGLSGNRKTYAAMMLAMDRAIGQVMAKLDDPDGDPNTADSVRENTLVVFMNDNGGDRGIGSSNQPLRGYKGNMWEGGVRVPLVLSGAGIAPGQRGSVFNAPVSSVDLVPTLVAAAGGNVPAGQTDGVDLLPYVNGLVSGAPHAFIYHLNAYRAGDDKIVYDGGRWKLYDIAADIGETTDLAAAEPERLLALQQGMTLLEAEMDKQRFGGFGDLSGFNNDTDHFVFQPQADSGLQFSANNAWRSAEIGDLRTLQPRDGYANATLEFPTDDSFSYSANNNLLRRSNLDFMCGEIKLSGHYTGTGTQAAIIAGNPIVLVDRLDSQPATIALNATGVLPGQFGFEITAQILLLDDLSITGEGNQMFILSGGLDEYGAQRSIVKQGNSTLVLASATSLTGAFALQAGTTITADPAALGDGDVQIAAGATLVLQDALSIGGDYSQASGGQTVLTLGEAECVVSGRATLDGALIIQAGAVSLAPGQSVVVFSASEFSGTFDHIAVPNGYIVQYNGAQVVVERS